MDGILQLDDWISPTCRIKAPVLGMRLSSRDLLPFYNHGAQYGLEVTCSEADLCLTFSSSRELTSFMQSWLFFGLLEGFLGHSINCYDFVRDDSIHIDQEAAHEHFRTWKGRLWKASAARKLQARKSAEDKIGFTLAKCDVFELAANNLAELDSDFDRVLLSIKLLASLLYLVLDVTFSKSSGTWAPWVHYTHRRVARWCSPALCFPSIMKLKEAWMSEMSNISPQHMAAESLQQHLHSDQARNTPLQGSDGHGGGRAATLLLELLRSNGWCPARARRVCQTHDYLVVNILAGLVRDPFSNENHAQCFHQEQCVAHNLQLGPSETYPYRHCCGGGHCVFVSIPWQELADIIQSGDKPLISINKTGPLDVKLVRWTPFANYTAISHIWSDGLGNPRCNALPYCQLVRLRDLAQQGMEPEFSPFYDNEHPIRSAIQFIVSSYGDASPHVNASDRNRIVIWIDTLCIPVPPWEQDESAVNLRFAAIKQISSIFSGAAYTLVLDRCLEELIYSRPGELCGDEFAATVLGSKWMERGWTLQEGSLSFACVMQIAGKPYNIYLSLKNRLPWPLAHSRSPLETALIDARYSLVYILRRALLDYKRTIARSNFLVHRKKVWRMIQTETFSWAWNSLVSRSLTRTADATFILASVLDLHIYPLRNLTNEERVVAVIQSCNVLPLSLLFNTGPRLTLQSHPGLGWLPTAITGDLLYSGPILRKVKDGSAALEAAYYINLRNHSRRLLVLCTGATQRLEQFFTVSSQLYTTHNHGAEDDVDGSYVVEMIRTASDEPAHADVIGQGEISATLAVPYYMVIDLSYGSRSKTSFAGKGVCFRILTRDGNCTTLCYVAPLIARTVRQWRHKTGYHEAPEVVATIEDASYTGKLILKCGMVTFILPSAALLELTTNPNRVTELYNNTAPKTDCKRGPDLVVGSVISQRIC